MRSTNKRETDALRQVTERLRQQFPHLSPDQIEDAVAGRYASFDNAMIRDFVPVLVERGARRQLATASSGTSAS